MISEPTPDDEAFSPDSLNTPREFSRMLNRLRSLSAMSLSDLAQETGMSPDAIDGFLRGPDAIDGYLRRRRLPNSTELHNLLLALKVRSRLRQDEWQAALIRVEQYKGVDQAFRPYVLTDAETAFPRSWHAKDSHPTGEPDDADLLVRVYIPSARLYAAEASRLVSLFREWLTMTRRCNVRQSGYHTASGDMYEFFVEASTFQDNLSEEFDNFSDFLTLCSEDASAAADVLTSVGIDRTSSVRVVARFGREVQRLQIDLRHEREQRMLTIRHSLEEQLLESGADLRDIPRSQINALIESRVPGPTAPESLTLLAAPWTVRPAAPVTVINHPQIINAMESTIIQNVRGTVHLGLQAQKLLAFIEEYGCLDAATLQAAVYELEDPAAPQAAKSGAKDRLRKFVSQVAEFGRDVGVELLADYLKSKGL